MAITQKLLGEAVGIQFTGTRDETGTNPILGLTDGLIVGQFRRGRMDKPMRITQQNIRAELGYEPNNRFYQAVQAVLDQLPFVWVLRLGSAGGGGGGEIPLTGIITATGLTGTTISTASITAIVDTELTGNLLYNGTSLTGVAPPNSTITVEVI